MTMLELSVSTGEVKSAANEAVLVADALGSCVAVIVLDEVKNTGAMAHVMMPGEYTKDTSPHRLKYAVNAIRRLGIEFESMGSSLEEAKIFLVGGANVLKKPDDLIAQSNIDDIKRILKQKKLTITAEAVGGELRRTAVLYVNSHHVMYSEGDGESKTLWVAP